MQLLTNEITQFLQASYIEMISLLKYKYMVMLAHQLVGFEQLFNVFKKAIFEKKIRLFAYFGGKREELFSTQVRSNHARNMIRLYATFKQRKSEFFIQYSSKALSVLETTFQGETLIIIFV